MTLEPVVKARYPTPHAASGAHGGCSVAQEHTRPLTSTSPCFLIPQL